jgi:hypothetical protein
MQERHGTIGGDVEAEDELLEVGTVIFVVAVRDPRFPYRARVLTTEGHRSGIEVDSPGLEPEEFDRTQGELKEDPAASELCQLFEGTAHAVIIDGEFLLDAQAESIGLDGLHPFPEAIEGITAQKHIVNEDRDRGTVTQDTVSIGVDVLVEDTCHGELLEKVLDDRVRTKPMDLESSFPCGILSSKDRTGLLLFHGAEGCTRSRREASAI